MPPRDDDAPRLEERKLQLEIAELEATAKTRWTGTYWPVFAAVVAAAVTLIGYLATSAAQRAQDRRTAFERSLTWATDSQSPSRRAAGATALGLDWGSNDDAVIASTLASLLADRDATVRSAAVAAIDQAITGSETVRQCAANTLDRDVRRRIEILYGEGHKGTIGVVPRQLSVLQGLSSKERLEDYVDPALDAAQQAIRVNWECLRSANLREVNLGRLELYEANLQEANLIDAGLYLTNLRGADLSGALLNRGGPTSDKFSIGVQYTNVKDLRAPAGFRDWALEKKAVDLNEEDWRRFKTTMGAVIGGDTAFIGDWNTWRKNGFKFDQEGRPIDRDGLGRSR